MEKGILSKILDRFLIYLEVLPENLRLFCFSALFFFITIDIALVIYNNLGNENFSYIDWGKKKILKVGFIMFALYKYEWLLNGVKSFFFYAVEKAIRSPIATGEYFTNPSYLVDKGIELAVYVTKAIGYHPKTWVYTVFAFLIFIGFIVIAIQLIICWIEFYFLTGFSIIFLPFGALDMGLEYYKNVFKTIISATIKLAVLSFWVSFSNVILDELFSLANKTDLSFSNIGMIAGVVYVLMAIMTVLPSMTSGLLTGSPMVNASAAISGAMSATGGAVVGTYHAARGTFETLKGAYKGAKTGVKAGQATSTFIGGPAGAVVGTVVGGAVGTVGAVVGGSYAGTKYGVTKQESKKDSKENKINSTSHSNTNSEIKNTPSSTNNVASENKNISTQNSQTTASTINNQVKSSENTSGQTTNISTSNNFGTTISSDTTASNSSTNIINNEIGNQNISSSGRVKNNLPNWAKEDY